MKRGLEILIVLGFVLILGLSFVSAGLLSNLFHKNKITGEAADDCTPNCTGRVCGLDSVCGTSCGSCSTGQTCNSAGQCIPSTPAWQTGLVSWWKLNGNASDSIGTNHGTVNGATLTSIGCKSGQCYSFDGVNDYLNVPSSQFLPLIGKPYTLSAWINDNTTAATLTSSFHRIISFANGAINIQLGLANTGGTPNNRIFYIQESSVTSNARQITSGNASNGWHHVVATSNEAGAWSIYLDGVLSNGGTTLSSGSTVYTTNTGLLYMGQRGNGGYVNGKLDEVMIWNRSLSSTEIQQVYNPYQGCTSSSQCNDSNVCTTEFCAGGSCAYALKPNCCTSDSQCNDSNVCTKDVCTGGSCEYISIPGCCTSDSQCNDSNVCTTEFCAGGSCAYALKPNCCTSSSQCNDSNACTNDVCAGGSCTNVPITCNVGYTCNSAGQCVPSTSTWQTGLVSWWKLNGNASDSIGTNHGTVNGATLTSTGCKSGQCYSFDGVNDYVNIKNPGNVFDGKNITLSAWVVYNRGNDYQRIIDRGYANQFSFWISTSPQLGLSLDTLGTDIDSSSSCKILPGVLTHIVYVYDSETVWMYKNGVYCSSLTSASGVLDSSTNDIRIGARVDTGSNRYWNGSLDEVMVWNRVLSSTEIQQVYNSFSACTPNCAGKVCGSDGCGGSCGSYGGGCPTGYICQTNGTCIRNIEIIRCDNSETNINSDSSLNIFFVGSGYDSNQLFCKDKCNLTDFSKVLENDIYRFLYNDNKTQGFGLLTIEPFKPNLDKLNIYMLTSPINCDYKVNRYCFFNFREQVANLCAAYNPDDYIYVIIGYDDSETFGLGGGTPSYYSVSHRKGQHEFEDTVSVFIHEFGHSLGLHDLYLPAYQNWDPQVMVNSSSIPNCDNTPGCPKWCKGKALPPFQTVCSNFLNKEDCIAHSTDLECLWFDELEPYFKTRCVRNADYQNHNIGTECINGTGCYWGCATAGYRPVSPNNFADRFSQTIDSSGKKHIYEPVSEKFIRDIFNCCYPQSCTQYDSNYCRNFSRTYPQYERCSNPAISGCKVCTSISQCDDNDTCTTDSCTNNLCAYTLITSCTNNDGCCPTGCTSVNDNDCQIAVSCNNNGNCDIYIGETCANCVADCGCSLGYTCNSAGQCIPSTPAWQTGMVSWWKLNGDASDSVGTNHGTVNGATLTSTGCKSGQCYSFDGVNDYLNTPSSQFLPLIGKPYTFSAWVNDNSSVATLDTTYHRIISFANGAVNIQLGLASRGGTPNNRIFYIQESTSGTVRQVTSGNVSNGWHHLVATSNGAGTWNIYLDGVLSNGGTTISSSSTPYITNTGWLYMGQRGNGGYVQGKLDEVMIWNRSLSSTEIQQVYNSFSTCTPNCAGKVCGTNGCGGSCGICSLTNAVASCSASYQCVISSCNSGYSDCDLSASNGCEIQLGTTSNCASCGNHCSTEQTCTNSVCINRTILVENKKNMGYYSNKEVFLISDRDWEDILQLVPLTIWTGNESCKRGYGTPDNVCVYPTLIFHYEDGGFDADSIIYFMQQYNTEKVTIIGETPQELDNLLVAQPELGAGISSSNIKRMSPVDYLYYWNTYQDVVYVEDNYELALVASAYASLVNSPLVITGTELDVDSIFEGKNVICVGETSGRTCNEQYNLSQLQQKYVQKTNTDKIILVNPNDLTIMVNESFQLQPEKSFNHINETYGKNSLVAPILAGAKHELILTTAYADYNYVDKFIEDEIRNLQFSPEYLTIVASPNAIDMTFEGCLGEYCSLSTDAWQYSLVDGDLLLDLAVGRIFGITISDSSSYSARSLFYEETLKNNDKILVTGGLSAADSAAGVYALGKVLSATGYNTTVTPNGTIAEDWKNKFFISYNDHGSPIWAGIGDNEIPPLENSFILAIACSTCDFKGAVGWQNALFCANAIRKGAIGYIGAVDHASFDKFQGFWTGIFSQEETIGKAFINQKNSISVFNGYLYDNPSWGTQAQFLLLGDPTLKLITVHTMPKPQLNLTSTDSNGEKYKLIVPAMRIEIPEDIKNLCEIPEQYPPFYYFITAYMELQRNCGFSYRADFQFQPITAVYPFGWTLVKESDINGNKLWISHSCQQDIGFFTTANSNAFTNFEFDVWLLNEAADLTIEDISMSGHRLIFNITNTGNKDATDVNYTYISLWILNCSDESCYQPNSFYHYGAFQEYHPFANGEILSQNGYKQISLDIPSEDDSGVRLNNGQIIRVDLSIHDLENKIIQSNYTNDAINKILVVN